jgi:hypothetical protein
MKTDKEIFVDMLKSTTIPFYLDGDDVNVENSFGMGYSGFSSCWSFDKNGKLESVGHYEN